MQTIAVLFALLHLCASKELPSFIEKCEYTEGADVGDCIKDRIKVLKPKLEKGGIPEMRIPPIEPLHLPKMELHTGSGTNVAFDAVLQDMDISGCKDLVMEEFRFDFKNFRAMTHVKIPHLYAVGTYVIKGKVLLFDLQAKGGVTANITGVDATTNYEFDVVERNGKKYLELKTTGIEVSNSFTKAVFNLDKLFDNQELNDQVNNAINENAQELANDVAPLVHEATHLLVVGLMNPVFKDYSIDELFITN